MTCHILLKIETDLLNTKMKDKIMAKEWILNNAMNRFQLNFKRNVGPTSESRLLNHANILKFHQFYS